MTRYMDGKEISEEDLRNIILKDEKVLEIIERVIKRVNDQVGSEVA